MQDFKTAIHSAIDEYYAALEKSIDGLTYHEFKWQPTLQSNSILWLMWHMARVEDRWVNQTLKNDQELWISEKWHGKFNMTEDDHGAGDDIDKIRSFPDFNIQTLKDYYDQVHDSVITCLENSTDKDLSKEFSHKRLGFKKGDWIWGHIIVEESQHLGQIAYIRGMIKGING